LQGGVVGLRRSLEQCDCGLALPKSSVQIRVSRPDLVRDLVALDVRPRFCRVNVGLRLGQAVFACASIKDSPFEDRNAVRRLDQPYETRDMGL